MHVFLSPWRRLLAILLQRLSWFQSKCGLKHQAPSRTREESKLLLFLRLTFQNKSSFDSCPGPQPLPGFPSC